MEGFLVFFKTSMTFSRVPLWHQFNDIHHLRELGQIRGGLLSELWYAQQTFCQMVFDHNVTLWSKSIFLTGAKPDSNLLIPLANSSEEEVLGNRNYNY